MYSQNNEEQFILEYFADRVGRLCDIGANDGITLSNSRALIERGWSATLVEPAGSVFPRLQELYRDNTNVTLVQAAIYNQDGTAYFHESGTHLNNGDSALLSTLKKSEIDRWRGTAQFKQTETQVISWTTLLRYYPGPYDFITIDAEGVDYEILEQIDLAPVSMVCVEHNGKEIPKYIAYCEQFGMHVLLSNDINVIMVK